jgi:hypothetical protein
MTLQTANNPIQTFSPSQINMSVNPDINAASGVVTSFQNYVLTQTQYNDAQFIDRLRNVLIRPLREGIVTFIENTESLTSLNEAVSKSDDLSKLQDTNLSDLERSIRRIKRMNDMTRRLQDDAKFHRSKYEFYQGFFSFVLVVICIVFVAVGFAMIKEGDGGSSGFTTPILIGAGVAFGIVLLIFAGSYVSNQSRNRYNWDVYDWRGPVKNFS